MSEKNVFFSTERMFRETEEKNPVLLSHDDQ